MLPQPSLVAVVPVRIRSSVNAVLARLPNINGALSGQDEALLFSLRDDPHARPLYGTKSATSQLVKVVRRVSKRSRKEKSVTTSLVGVADQQWLFEGLSDFQLTDTRAKRPKLELSDSVTSFMERVNASEPNLAFPAQWARSSQPWEYDYTAESRPAKIRKPGFEHAIAFGATPPLQHPDGTEGAPPLLARIINVFATARPVMSLDALLLELWRETPDDKPDCGELRELLPRAAYSFRAGPFCRLWIRYGFDSSKEPTARFFQVFTFRDRGIQSAAMALKPTRARAGAARKEEAEDESERDGQDKANEEEEEGDWESLERRLCFQSDALPRYYLFQLCDMAIPAVRQLVFHSPPADQCTKANGWYQSGVLRQVREAVTAHRAAPGKSAAVRAVCPTYDDLLRGKFPH